MSARPSSSTTPAPAPPASSPEDSSPGASGAATQPQGAAVPGADTTTESEPAGPPPGAPGALDAAVLIQDARWTHALPAAEDRAARAVHAAWAALPEGARPSAPAGAEVSVVLACDAAVRDLNRDYRGQDKPTNVLSFANLEGVQAPDLPVGEPVLLGDLVLARETVLSEAEAQGKAPGDHLSHLCVHGLLHLLGYDHMADAEAETMEALERRVLAGLGIADPYAPAAHAGEAASAGGAS